MTSLKGKTLFVSGASRGIGLAIALRAARDGANVAIAAKTAEPHPKLKGTIYTAAEEIRAAGGKALPVLCDIRDEAQVIAAIEQTVERQVFDRAHQPPHVLHGLARRRFHGHGHHMAAPWPRTAGSMPSRSATFSRRIASSARSEAWRRNASRTASATWRAKAARKSKSSGAKVVGVLGVLHVDRPEHVAGGGQRHADDRAHVVADDAGRGAGAVEALGGEDDGRRCRSRARPG